MQHFTFLLLVITVFAVFEYSECRVYIPKNSSKNSNRSRIANISGRSSEAQPSENEVKNGEDSSSYGYSVDKEDGKEKDCICVPYYQCDNGKIVDDGSGILDPRREKKKPSETEIPLNGKFRPPFCGTYHVCCTDPSTTSTSAPYIHKCGIRNPSGLNSRVLTPTSEGESDFGEWPWMVAVLQMDGNDKLFACGGTLIDEYHVLTVAHCANKFLDMKNDLKVRLGEWDTQTEKEFYKSEDYGVSEIYIHPEFRESNLWNDLALLRLDREVKFKPNIDSICLPTPDENHDYQECVTTGWGKTAYMSEDYSNILKEVALKIVPRDECQRLLRKTRLGIRFRLHDGFLCAGGEEGKDSCKGDGGGPLVCYRKDGTYSLMGIVAWGIDCGKANSPGVYVKVQKYLNWIGEKTGKSVNTYWSAGDVNKSNKFETY